MEKLVEKGLTSAEVQEKIKIFGKNEIISAQSSAPLLLFISQFPTFINAILAGASLLSFVVGNLIDGIFILSVLVINAIFGFVQEYKAEKSLQKLKDYVKTSVRVVRDGKETQISTTEIVPGDIVVLSEGDRIPADGKLRSNKPIEIDESILTGESIPVVKNKNDTVFLGTLITRGRGLLFIEKIGMETRFGKIARTLSTLTSEKTPFQKRLDGLGKTITFLVIAITLFLIIFGVWQGKEFLPLAILAISVGVAAIPEGLPVIITIALAIGVSRMAKKRAIVRKMASVETLGAVQIILIDKTGTLTQNSQTVKKIWLNKKDSLTSLLKACIFGNTASLIQKVDKNSFDIVGSKTDGALLLFAKAQLKDIERIKNTGKIIDEYSFDPDRKTITTLTEENGKKYVYVRGAPEVLLNNSKVDKEQKKRIFALIEEYARDGLRVIGFGTKLETHPSLEREHIEKDLEFLGFVGIYDPPRPEVKQAVEKARLAGIRTIMVTGDNELTALAIAKEVELIEKDEDVATGEEIEKLSDEDLSKIILKTRIFARNKPEDKLRLVTILKNMGYVVGVTGDGVNDALALKKSDVGIAMGEKGTDVAKEASDIVLTDDNFSTLVGAVEEGRTIYNNITKSITYLISGNLSEISLVFFASIFGMPNPLLPTQILWVNIVTDSVPSLALASDNKDHEVLKLKPRNPNAPILSNHRLIFILATGFSLAFMLLLVFKLSLGVYSETFSRTIIFNLLVISHMTLAFLIRGKSMFKMNKFLVIGVTITLFLQVVITITPFFQNILHLGF
ncbi:MAG: cation-translocating P-type ATPase [Candidatus Levybacteria bacterium]|nr:cation-translocating P-type ATPase [Candidatus Levybacteria bacterium]